VNVAIIPARGGSKRIPRKNIRPFAGRPIIGHSIACALQAGIFDRVIVSTDDPEIASVSTSFGAEVPFLRPAELADDHTGTTDVIAHACNQLTESGVHMDAVCAIYPTAPFLRAEDLVEGLRILQSVSWSFVFSASTFEYPIFRAFRRQPSGGIEMVFPEHFDSRSQDLAEAVHDAGQFYWGRPDAWLRGERIFSPRATVVMIPRWRAQDIDTEEDWQRAEMMARSVRPGE
jgi:pseudaminic acid cytidylyltransferase